MANRCFAFCDDECQAREDTVICQRLCPFFKTHAQHERDVKQCYERLAQLDYGQQVHIAAKYYAGRMPWLK